MVRLVKTGQISRPRHVLLALAASAALVHGYAHAQTRPYTPSLTCSAVQAIVAQQKHIVLATSPNAYELVHVDGGACNIGMTAVPAFEPTLDNRNCFAGYRCKDRNNDATGTR